MKTLDEVIDAFEWCMHDDDTDCSQCPYYTGKDTDCHDRNVDALYYLKVFRDAKNALDAELERIIEAYCQFEDAKERLEAQTSQMMWVDKHFQFEISDNPPLTWEELKQMEGKPIWVEEKDMPSTWIIIWDVTENWLYPTGCDGYRHEEYGKTWNAYRKERE